MQRVKFNLQMNGWANTIAISTESKGNANKTIVDVKCEVIGVAERDATLNLETKVLTLAEPITMSSYSGGKDKVFTTFKVPKMTILQIKEYIN